MIREVELSAKKIDLKLQLAKPNKQLIGNLPDAFDRKMTIKLGQISELTFTLPVEVEKHHQLVRSKAVDFIRERFLIKATLNNTVEWFIVDKISKNMSDNSDVVNVSCKSLGYELYSKRIKDYKVDAEPLTSVLLDVLQGTGWGIGTLDTMFSSKYRSFDISSATKLDAVLQIAETFGGVAFFNGVSRTIDIIHLDNIGVDKGLKFTPKQYLINLEYENDFDSFCTRLKVYGADGVSIHSVNPIGQSFVESYNFFLFPFSRDEDGNVIKSSDYMTDSLAIALTDYQEKVESRSTDFANYLSQKSTYQSTLTTKQNELATLNTQLKTILDSIAVAQEAGEDTSTLNTQKANKESEIATKNSEIDTVNANIASVDSQISDLRTDLSYETNFTSEQLEELQLYIIEQEITETNISDPTELLTYVNEKFVEMNTPPLNVKTSIVNFLDCISEQRNWSKLVIGDKVTAINERLNVNIKAKIEEIEYDFDNGDIQVSITNAKKINDEYDKFVKRISDAEDTTNTFNQKSINWNTVAFNFDSRNDRISTVPANPIVANDGTAIDHTLNDDGSANISFEWGFNPTNSTADQFNIDGFVIYIRSLSTNEQYTFGSTIAKELVYTVAGDKRALIISGVPANQFYTIGVQAYRNVDEDINASGVLKSQIVKSTYASENPYQPTANVEFSGNISGTIDGVTVTASNISGWNTTQTNFNSRNDRKSTTPANPTILTDGTAVDHVINTDGSANLSFEWGFSGTGDAYDIDGFIVYVRESTTNSAYTFGTSPVEEQVFHVTPDKKAFILYGVAADKFYTLGVQSYRVVDQDINSTGMLKSAIIKPTLSTENPYQPSTSVSFGGDITGTVNGTAASTIKNAVTNFNNRNDRKSTTPANPTITLDGSAVDHTINDDGSADISFEWNFTGTGDAYDIDGFTVYVNQSSSSSAYTFGTTVANEQVYNIPADKRAFILYGVAANKYYTFGIQAYRIVDNDVVSGGIIKSAIVKSTFSGENPYRPVSNVAFTGNVIGTINGQTVTVTETDAWNGAVSRINELASDNKLTPVEKQATKKEIEMYSTEKPTLESQATTYNLTTDKTNYTNSYNALITYITPLLSDLSTTSDIVRNDFTGKFKDYRDKKSILSKAITDKSKEIYDGIKVGGNNLLYKNRYSINFFNSAMSNSTSKYGFLIPTGQTYVAATVSPLSLKVNTEYTISFTAWCSGTVSVLYNDLFPDTLPENNWNLTNTPTRYFWILQSSDTNMNNCQLRFFTNSLSDVYITDIKLEEGNKPSMWTQALDEISKTPSTFIIADGSTTSNPLRADYVIPAGSINAQDVINAAINALPANGGKVVLLEGTFKINNSIIPKNNVTIEGMGQSTIIQTTDTASSYYAINMDRPLPVSSIKISNLKIKGTNNSSLINPTSGITIANFSKDIILDKISFIYLKSDGSILTNCIKVDGSSSFITITNSNFENCQLGVNTNISNNINISNNNFKNLSIAMLISVNPLSNSIGNVYIDQNYIENTTSYGIFVSGGGAGVGYITNVFITNNIVKISSLAEGIYAGGLLNSIVNNNTIEASGRHGIRTYYCSNCTVSNNSVKDSANSGFYIEASSDNTISNNTSAGNGTSATGTNHSAIFITNASNNNNVNGNTCRKNISTNQRYGVYIATSDCNKNRIANNDLLTSGATSPTFDAGTSSDISSNRTV